MPRKRSLSPGFFKNEALSDIDPLGRILFQGLWCFADRNGNLEYRPKLLKAEVLPYESSTNEVVSYLEQLASNLLISFYEVEGSKYIHVTNFIRYQSPHPEEKAIWPVPESYQAIATIEKQVEPESQTSEEDTETACQQVADNLQESCQQSFNSNSNLISSKEEIESVAIERVDKISEQVNEVFEHWKSVLNHPRSILDAKRRRLITLRLKDGFSVERLKLAVDGCRASPHHMGQNDRSMVYDGVDLIFRDVEHVERFESYTKRNGASGNVTASQNGNHKANGTAGQSSQQVSGDCGFQAARTI